MDKNELKVVALKESISEIVAQYEDRIATLRADLTIQGTEITQLTDQVNSLNSVVNEYQQKENEKNVSKEEVSSSKTSNDPSA